MQEIEAHEIQIWSGDLLLTPLQETELCKLLSVDEQERAQRFHFPIHQQRFIAARSLLRRILSLYIDVPPAEIVFDYNAKGKPSLASNHLQFNLSHSDDKVVIAIATQGLLGVDIEKIHDHKPEIAERFFSASEYQALQHSAEDQQRINFYRIWCRKEAIIKAIGHGLSISLASFSVSLEEVAQCIQVEQETLLVMPLAIHPEFQAAVASNQLVKKITYWELFEHSAQPKKISP